MATHPSWSGVLKASPVVCPIRLCNATTQAHSIAFRFIHPKTRHRIRMRPYDPALGLVKR
ncbi:MAG: hypothetical protein ACHQF3_03605 [Alphaproteobacteria bacterium]